MSLIYEEHQRNYTVLATSIVMDELCNGASRQFFSYRPHPIYLALVQGKLSHFIAITDLKGWPLSWARHNDLGSLRHYKRGIDRQLRVYQDFLRKPPDDIRVAVDQLHQFIRLFTPIIFLAAYLPRYGRNLNGRLVRACWEAREQYELVHKNGIHRQRQLLRRLETEIGLPADTLALMIWPEFHYFWNSGYYPRNLMKRKHFFLLEHAPCQTRIYPNLQGRHRLELLRQAIGYTGDGRLPGQVSYPGRVFGRVRVIFSIHELNTLRRGEVLVTPMTDPRYVPALRRVRAIITDEGGVTCHAAIVSREFKIPCIVGTKNATRVLKDGDRVEVDATKGIVRKL